MPTAGRFSTTKEPWFKIPEYLALSRPGGLLSSCPGAGQAEFKATSRRIAAYNSPCDIWRSCVRRMSIANRRQTCTRARGRPVVGQRRQLSADGVHEAQHPAVDLLRVVDLRSVAGVGDNFGAGPGYQTWNALHLPLWVHEEASLAKHQIERGANGGQFVLGQGEWSRAAYAVGADTRSDHCAQLRHDEDGLFQPGCQSWA